MTWPLAAFLAGVAGLLGTAWLVRYAPTDIQAAMRQLADGDDDGAERGELLQRLLTLAGTAADDTGRWAGRLAAVALADRPAYDRYTQALGGEPGRPPASTARWLDLGDPMLGNLLRAAAAEAAAHPDEARRHWLHVANQARLTARPFAGELAAAALLRLR